MSLIPIESFKHETKNGHSRVSANVAGEEVWFSSPDIDLKLSPEGILSAFLIVAQHKGDTLRCDLPVCDVWMSNVMKLMQVTANWWQLNVIRPLVPQAEKPRGKRGEKTAVFFTGGVDSFFTLLHRKGPVHALVNVHGMDISLDNEPRYEAALSSYQAVAADKKLPLICIKTNLRQHAYFKSVNWEKTHGAAMAAVAYFLSGEYTNLVLSSSYTRSNSIAWGSSWQIDHLWSGKNLKFESWGDHLWRSEKLAAIANDSLVKNHLRVCWQAAEVAANCGVCQKCTKTIVALKWRGKYGRFEHLFEGRTSLAKAVGKWKVESIRSEAEINPPVRAAETFSEPLRSALIAHRKALRATIPEKVSQAKVSLSQGLLPDRYFEPVMRLSLGHHVYYHKVPGNVGDDLIHAAALQLFERFKIKVVKSLDDASQVVLCGGGSIGIWSGCEDSRKVMYRRCKVRGLPLVLHPQSIANTSEIIPDIVKHRFVRDKRSLELMPEARLVPDLALAYHLDQEYDAAAYDVGIFLRSDAEGLFHDFSGNLGDPKLLVPRKLKDYFKLAACYKHLITDRLHFAIAGLHLKRRVTLLPNAYHKNRSVWEAWLRDLGCEWSEDPALVQTSPLPEPPINPKRVKPLAPARVSNKRLGMVMCVHDEELLLEANLRYHHALGVDVAYLFFDRCTDRSEEIAGKFPWVKVIKRASPDEPYFFRSHQTRCMDDALEMARKDGVEWLLGIDADEFAFADNEVPEGRLTRHERQHLRAEQQKSPQIRRWLKASLRYLLKDVSADVLQVVLATRETLPTKLEPGEPFWKQEHFLREGVYPGEIRHPETGEWQRTNCWLGHKLGKPIIRTSARLQSFNAHRWTTWQGTEPPVFAANRMIPTLMRGWHAHYLVFDTAAWLRKYRAVARQHENWPCGTPVEFPKLEWSRAAKNMSEKEAESYLHRGVQISHEKAMQWSREHRGVVHQPVLAKLLKEITLQTSTVPQSL